MPRKKDANREEVLELYRSMAVIRRAEETLSETFAAGEVPGFIHVSIGQEATPAGLSSVLGPQDTVASNHRGHGHALAKGLGLEALFREIFGKAGGSCGGRGGSMHVADFSVGMLGANGIVGAGIPIAAGSALALKAAGNGHIAVAYFGDGALAEGVLHETLNIAALWELPMLFLCENNGWAEFSKGTDQIAFDALQLAAAYGLPTLSVDGNDVEAVAEAAAKIIAPIRTGEGPAFLQCVTTRLHGHFEGDPQRYREKDDIAAASSQDPLVRLRGKYKALSKDFDDVDSRVADEVAHAARSARDDVEPDFEEAIGSVYA